MKPRIFVSTVTTEFKTARTKIEHVLEFLGYEVEQQDIFGTEGGDLRQMLREKIDACDALIQLAGDGYGAEPPTVDPGQANFAPPLPPEVREAFRAQLVKTISLSWKDALVTDN